MPRLNQTKNVTLREPSDDEIRALAFQIFEARAGAPGSPDEDWARARLEILNTTVITATK